MVNVGVCGVCVVRGLHQVGGWVLSRGCNLVGLHGVSGVHLFYGNRDLTAWVSAGLGC